jgi:hypothetical protein
MVYTMRALRNNHEILLNTMDVFVKEPSLDWQVSSDLQCWPMLAICRRSFIFKYFQNFARKQADKQKLNLGKFL